MVTNNELTKFIAQFVVKKGLKESHYTIKTCMTPIEVLAHFENGTPHPYTSNSSTKPSRSNK